MNVFIVDEGFSGSLESKLEQSVYKFLSEVRDAGVSLKKIFKLNVFLKTDNESELSDIREEFSNLMKKEFSKNMPAYTIVSQPSLSGNDILLEGVSIDEGEEIKIERRIFYKHPYVVLSSGKNDPRMIVSGGISVPGEEDLVFESQRVLDFAEQLLLKEDLDYSHIISQSNYIPSIFTVSKYGNEKLKNIQVYDNVRSLYYSTELFKDGHPELTATGTNTGDITMDFVALSGKMPSEDGDSGNSSLLSTDMFVNSDIVTEELSGMNTEEQTKHVLRSILQKLSVSENGDKISYLRIYLKDKADLPLVKSIIGQNINAVNIVYLEADISNEDMKIYMEAIK